MWEAPSSFGTKDTVWQRMMPVNKMCKCTVKPLKVKNRKPPEHLYFICRLLLLATKRNDLQSKSLWKQKVGRSELIKNRSANDRQHHVCTEMECSHKSLTHTCNVLS